MKTIFYLIVSILILIIAAGLLLPAKRKISKSYEYNANIQLVWNRIRNIPEQTSWRPEVKEIKIISQSPLIWSELTRDGNLTVFQSQEEETESKWQIKIIEPAFIEVGWIGKVEKNSNGGTRVLFTESIQISNPFFRILSHIFFDMNKTMNLYLQNLAKSLGENYEEERIKTTLE